jgi:transposase
MRALTRAREATRSELQAATCRLNAFVLRHAIRSTGRATWQPAPRRGLAEVVCPPPAQPLVCQADVRAVTAHPARLPRLDQARHAQVTAWRLHPVVAALPAWRGVPCTGAVIRVAARGDRPRFATPSARMPCVGLMPAASATGERRRHGSRTTAGHTHARRALVDGAWASRNPAQVRWPLHRRRAQPPTAIQDLRWKAQVRRCQRSRKRIARGQHANQVVGAMARELMGGMGALAKAVPVTPEVALGEAH